MVMPSLSSAGRKSKPDQKDDDLTTAENGLGLPDHSDLPEAASDLSKTTFVPPAKPLRSIFDDFERRKQLRWLAAERRCMLSAVWAALAGAIGVLQLLVLTQPEWIVRGSTSLGLFALCTPTKCVLRPASLVPLLSLFCGALLLLASVIFLIPFLLCSQRARPLRIIANMQFIAALLAAMCVLSVPFDMEDVHCSISDLLQSKGCRVGWAYAVSSVCALLGLCFPVLGKLVAEERGFRYALLLPSKEKKKISPEGICQHHHKCTGSAEYFL